MSECLLLNHGAQNAEYSKKLELSNGTKAPPRIATAALSSNSPKCATHTLM